VVLKVMHIIYHLAGRQALLRLAISDDAIFREIELKVLRVVEELRAAGCAVAEFEWSRKPRDSQITKLLAKRSTLAANIYDKLRFRLIVPREEDLVRTLATLTRQLIPFNYVVPGESINQLVDLPGLLEDEPHLAALAPKMQGQAGGGRRLRTRNEFSGPEYRIINFVADLPLRLGRLVPASELGPDDSHVVFVLTEFQIADKATAVANESGACSHEAYKARQHDAGARAPTARRERSAAGGLSPIAAASARRAGPTPPATSASSAGRSCACGRRRRTARRWRGAWPRTGSATTPRPSRSRRWSPS
jgi:uncharacterized protein (TIGR04552 family)